MEIVARTGSVRMTLAEVGEAAGYSRGLPAHRFGSKAGLLHALAAFIYEGYAARRTAGNRDAAGLEAIRNTIRVYFTRGENDWTTTRAPLVLMTEGFLDGDLSRADMAAYNCIVLAFTEAHFRAAIEQGEVSADEDPRTAAVILVGILRGVMLQRLVDDDVDLDAVRDRMLIAVDRMQVKSGSSNLSRDEPRRQRTRAKVRLAKPTR